MTLRRLAPVFLAAGILLLAGCVLPPQTPGLPSAHTIHRLEAIRGFEISGELGVVDRQRGFSGSFYWRDHRGRNLLIVTAPLGSGGFRLSGHSGDWQLVTSRGRILSVRHCLRCVLAHWFAVPVPIRSLDYWVRGLPDPGIPARGIWDSRGRLRHLTQEDWQLLFEHYGRIDGLPVPNSLILRYRSARIHLVVDRWTIWKAARKDSRESQDRRGSSPGGGNPRESRISSSPHRRLRRSRLRSGGVFPPKQGISPWAAVVFRGIPGPSLERGENQAPGT